VDGDFVPSLPSNLLAQGNYDTSVQIMTGFNAHETLYFTDPASTNNSAFESGISTAFSDIQPPIVNYIAQDLYRRSSTEATRTRRSSSAPSLRCKRAHSHATRMTMSTVDVAEVTVLLSRRAQTTRESSCEADHFPGLRSRPHRVLLGTEPVREVGLGVERQDTREEEGVSSPHIYLHTVLGR
jgi:hypothetical protein